LPVGAAAVTATISEQGKMSISMNGEAIATADAKGALDSAGDGLQVGDDKIKPVGKYSATTFSGAISGLTLSFK
jgi:hypothetical protein